MNFDRVARIYRLLETIVFGGTLQRARVHWLEVCRNSTSALIIGEGDGRFLCQLLRINPSIEVDCVEASGEMLELTRRRVKELNADALSRITFRHEDVRTCDLPASEYDVIVTHFVLDCFDEYELRGVVARLAAAATPEAIWLLADFQLPERGWGRWYARALVPMMYAFFRVAAGLKTNRLVDPTPALRAREFSCDREERTSGGMLKSQVWKHRGVSG